MAKERKLHIELLRMLAIFLVVFNHTDGYGWFAGIHGSPAHFPAMLFSALCKTAVPLFFMCSGALLIGREESLGTLLKKWVLRFVLVLLLFSLLTVLYDIGWDLRAFSPLYFLKVLWAGPVTESYWYLYRYIGFLLALPLLRRLGQAMGEREYRYMAWLMLLLGLAGLLPPLLLGESLELSGQLVLFFAEYAVFFPLLGYYLEQRLPETRCTGRAAALAALAGLAALGLMCLALERCCRHSGSWPRDVGELFFGRLNFLPAAAPYVAAKRLFLRRQPGPLVSGTLRLFGGCSFGVYLTQHFLLDLTLPLDAGLSSALGGFGACLVRSLLVCLLGTGVAWVLKQIPGLRKLL